MWNANNKKRWYQLKQINNQQLDRKRCSSITAVFIDFETENDDRIYPHKIRFISLQFCQQEKTKKK